MKASNWKKNRKKVLNRLAVGDMAIFMAADMKRKSADQFYAFVQDRDLYYLCGLDEPNVALVLQKNARFPEGQETLYIRRYSEMEAIWNGEVLDEATARKISGVDDVRFIDELRDNVSQMVTFHQSSKLSVNYPDSYMDEPLSSAHKLAQDLRLRFPDLHIKSSRTMMSKLRAFKEPWEIEQHRKAIEITRDTFIDALGFVKAGMNEYEVEAFLAYGFQKRGSKELAFETIAASGKNATILHYIKNNQPIRANSLVLLDFGATWNHYTADISRCIPVGAKFTKRSRQVYEAVLSVQKEMVEFMGPGKPMGEIRDKAIELIGVQCHKLGLIDDPADRAQISKYYMHGIGHQMGLDVHEMYGANDPLQPGMLITVEPGIYIREEGIGVRIEDDVLITPEGWENLSFDIPKEPSELLKIMKG